MLKSLDEYFSATSLNSRLARQLAFLSSAAWRFLKTFHMVVQQRIWGVVRYLTTAWREIYC